MYHMCSCLSLAPDSRESTRTLQKLHESELTMDFTLDYFAFFGTGAHQRDLHCARTMIKNTHHTYADHKRTASENRTVLGAKTGCYPMKGLPAESVQINLIIPKLLLITIINAQCYQEMLSLPPSVSWSFFLWNGFEGPQAFGKGLVLAILQSRFSSAHNSLSKGRGGGKENP